MMISLYEKTGPMCIRFLTLTVISSRDGTGARGSGQDLSLFVTQSCPSTASRR